MRLWRFSGNVLNQHTFPKFSEIGGSDGTRTRGLLRDRRSNQLNYAPAFETSTPIYSRFFPPAPMHSQNSRKCRDRAEVVIEQDRPADAVWSLNWRSTGEDHR